MYVLVLAIIQSLLFASGQVLLKYALERVLPFAWTAEFWKSVLLNWQFALCGLCYGAGTLLWFYIVKNYPLSDSYPMLSISYVFVLIAAVVLFHEPLNLAKFCGVLCIMLGCYLIAR